MVEAKRQKANDAQQQGARPLTDEEKRFVDHWCLGMRGVDQALFVKYLSDAVHKLVSEALQRENKSGLVKPDGGKL